MPKQINDAGLNLIKSFEGKRNKVYDDGVGVWTIGYGHAIGRDHAKALELYPNGITDEQCIELLRKDIQSKALGVEQLLMINVTDNQFAAMVSLAFNIGLGNFGKSTLLKLINLGKFAQASEQFEVWNKAGGNILAGLVRRRKAEKELFLKV